MLDNINKKNPFRVPENYFEDFHTNMMTKITQESKAKIVPLWMRLASWSAVAAAFVGIIIAVGFLKTTPAADRQTAETGNAAATQPEKVYASSSEDEDFYLYLENQVAKQSYYTAVNF
jgi:hypothetical protein